MSIDHNPPAGQVWLHERGAPYRSAHEFKQIAIDNRAAEEFFNKRILQLAKQSAAGVQEMYGKNYDFSLIKHILRDAMLLQRLDLPASMKPNVTRDQKIFLKRVLNACQGFNIPLLIELLDVKLPDVYTTDMCATGYNHYNIQAEGGNDKPIAAHRSRTMRLNLIERRQGSITRVDPKKNRENAIGVVFRAIKCQHKIYKRNMADIRQAFTKNDTANMGTLTHVEFQQSCRDLGLGLTDSQMKAFIAAVDVSGQGEIGYDEVLKPLHIEFATFNAADVPKKCRLLKMRKNERLKFMRDNINLFVDY